MFYEFDLTIPRNTPATALVELEVALDVGRIVAVEVQFPRGCIGLAAVAVRHEHHQLHPTNTDGFIAAEDARIAWQEDIDFTEPPYTLTLVGYNEDDSFDHTITFRFNLLPVSSPASPAPPGPPASAIIETFSLEL
jgi:hypothetical protein